LRRFIESGVIGLDDESRTRKRRALKVDLKTIEEVRKLQENPELGEFRMHAALKQLGIDLSPRTCGRIMARNRQLYGLSKPKSEPRVPREMPFRAESRHQFWTVDLRYLDMHKLGGGMIYVVSILENYSRAILASTISRSQDLSVYLIVLLAAIRTHGSPEAIVSDGGGIFKAGAVLRIYEALGITRQQIEARQPWQSYIETHFNVQRRMADWHFAKATTWQELQVGHERWVSDYNAQVHLAHRKREDGRRSPSEVLSWVTGNLWPMAKLQRVFQTDRCERRVDRLGYVRFRHWDIYGEQGLARQRVALWLSADAELLTLECSDEILAQYAVKHSADRRRLSSATPTHVFETRFRSPQLALWQAEAVDRRLALQRPDPIRQRNVLAPHAIQQSLALDDNSLALSS
jgi:transposase InsO family protein